MPFLDNLTATLGAVVEMFSVINRGKGHNRRGCVPNKGSIKAQLR